MKTSHRGIIAIEGREGIRLKVYRDSKGLPTVGVGHLIVAADNLKVGDRITQEQCDAFLADDLAKAEAAVNSIHVPLSQNQFDALVSFTVNIGTGGFKGSTVAKKLKLKDYNGAAQSMMNWVKPPEITGRRRSEQKQFLTPYPTSAVASTNGDTAASDGHTLVDKPTPIDESNPGSTEQPPILATQTADTIVNTGDVAQPLPPPTDISMPAPSPMGTVAASNKVMIGSIVVPASIVAIFKGLGNLISEGFVDAKDVGNTVINLIQNNFKYILALAGIVVLVVIVKKIERGVIFLATVISHMIPGFNSVTVVAPEAMPVTKSWWHFW